MSTGNVFEIFAFWPNISFWASVNYSTHFLMKFGSIDVCASGTLAPPTCQVWTYDCNKNSTAKKHNYTLAAFSKSAQTKDVSVVFEMQDGPAIMCEKNWWRSQRTGSEAKSPQQCAVGEWKIRIRSLVWIQLELALTKTIKTTHRVWTSYFLLIPWKIPSVPDVQSCP